MFKSDQTPAFGQMANQLFGQANATQQAGMPNQMLGSIKPGVLASLIGGAGAAVLGGILGKLTDGDAQRTGLTPEQASQLTPAQVRDTAHHAVQNSPGIIDKMSSFYAEHPGLVKTLGGAELVIALAIALAKTAENHPS